jgi:Na+/H+-dicarboxylate symporter
MGRSATNVVGNSIATAIVSKWEGELKSDAIFDANLQGKTT